MGFTFDTVIKTIPADQMQTLTEDQQEEKDKQERVASLHPACPKPVSYVGTRLGGYGEAYDYYRDEAGLYWYESRPATDPIVTEFIYEGGGKVCKKTQVSEQKQPSPISAPAAEVKEKPA